MNEQRRMDNNEQRENLKHMLMQLSKAELKVLELLANNLSSNDIAARLYLSFKTVQNHRANMTKKLGFSGHNSLLTFAIECKLMDLLGNQPHLFPTE
jgi:DNA-binding CsgD family transcriptional regulator